MLIDRLNSRTVISVAFLPSADERTVFLQQIWQFGVLSLELSDGPYSNPICGANSSQFDFPSFTNQSVTSSSFRDSIRPLLFCCHLCFIGRPGFSSLLGWPLGICHRQDATFHYLFFFSTLFSIYFVQEKASVLLFRFHLFTAICRSFIFKLQFAVLLASSVSFYVRT